MTFDFRYVFGCVSDCVVVVFEEHQLRKICLGVLDLGTMKVTCAFDCLFGYASDCVVFGLGNDGLAAAELEAVDLETAACWIVELVTVTFETIVYKRFESDMPVLDGFLFWRFAPNCGFGED